jgi:xanthine permease XanP
MLSFGVWGHGLAQLLCGLIGLSVGPLLAIPMGLFAHKDLAVIATARLFSLPNPTILSYRFMPDLIIPFVIASLASGLRTIGVITTAERINDAGWTRPNLANVRAGVMADGIGCALGGLLTAENPQNRQAYGPVKSASLAGSYANALSRGCWPSGCGLA